MHQLKRHWAAAVIAGLFVGLCLLYSVVVPVFEASDELHHFPYVAHLARGGSLPVQRAGEQTSWQQEGSQPPLYYALAAALIAGINTDDLPQVRTLNPHARIGLPLGTDNKNMVVHTDQEDFPWHGTVLAVHLVRLFSILLATGTILLTYRLALMVFPDNRLLAVGAMAFNAFIPMFVFISASVNNDNLVIFLASLTLVLLVRIIQRGASTRSLLILGSVISMACLAKLSALGLVPLAALALAVQRPGPGRSLSIRRWLSDCLILLLPVLLIAGWWYVRNWQLYGEPTGTSAMLEIAGRRVAAPSLRQLWGEFQGFRINFWGLFGGVNILLHPGWIYHLLDLMTILALAGLAAWGWRQHHYRQPAPWRELLLLVTWIAVEGAALLRWTMSTLASQGRLIFPALSAICVLLALGLTGCLPRRVQRWAVAVPGALLFLLSATSPFTAIRPAYSPAPILSPADVPASAQRFEVTYGDVARLLAFEVGKQAVQRGEALPVTLYWEVLQPTSESLSVYLQLVGPEDEILAQTDSFPGAGTRPTTLWKRGQVIQDAYLVPVRPNARGPIVALLEAGLYRSDTRTRLPATDPKGQKVNPPILARVKVAVRTEAVKPDYTLDANLDNRVRLIGYDLSGAPISPGGDLPITLYWEVDKGLGGDYTVFVHLLNEADQTVGYGDGVPMDSWYPTSFWEPGETLTDTHHIHVPPGVAPGAYRIAVGLYDPATGRRLPVVNESGEIIGDRVILGTTRLNP